MAQDDTVWLNFLNQWITMKRSSEFFEGLQKKWLQEIKLALPTWQEVEAYLERSKGVVVPLGSTEQHGRTA